MDEQLRVRISQYCKCWENYQPNFIEYAKKGNRASLPFVKESEKFLQILLFRAALNQNIDEATLDTLILSLYKTFLDKLFTISCAPSQLIENWIVTTLPESSWELVPKIVGIIRSVSDFFLVQGPIKEQILKCPSARHFEDILCTQLFYFGKSSPSRSKARNYIYLIRNLCPDLVKHWDPKAYVWPPTRHWWLALKILHLKPKVPPTTPEEVVVSANRFYNLVYPDAGLAYLAFSCFRKKSDISNWICRKQVGACRNCPLHGPCPGVAQETLR